MNIKPLLLFVLTVLALPAGLASAQNANEILDASRQAITEVSGFEAQFKMTGSGPSMFADTLPSMSGKLFMGTHSELGRVVHAIGEAKDKQTEPSKPMDVLIANDRLVWIVREKQEIHEVPNQPNTRGQPSSVSLIYIDTFVQPDPFAKDANGATDITHAGEQEINGVLCDQITITRPKPASGSRNTTQNYSSVSWWIGTEDKLPRKVSRITGEGSFAITLTFELSNLKIIEPSDKQLDVNRPESFRLISRLPSNEPVIPEQPKGDEPQQEDLPGQGMSEQGMPEQDASAQVGDIEQQTAPGLPNAPAFAFTTSDGASVNNSTQRDRVTLLYFWGSWCAPCGQTSPLVDELVTSLSEPTLDVFALAIREGKPENALRDFQQSYPNPRVSINPDGLASAFKVRVFPSIVVLNQDGKLVFQRSIERDLNPEQLIEAAREAISSALSDA